MASASTSATDEEPKRLDVFIVFRGDDIKRDGFLQDLFTEFDTRKYIHSFADTKLGKGDTIPDDLLENLDESRVIVVIFSPNFGDSKFCLDELVRIRERRKISDKNILPVFDQVTTDDVQNFRNSFGEGFAELTEKWGGDEQMIKAWRQAVLDISYISGFVSENYKTDYQLIKAIAEDVWIKLCTLHSANSQNDNSLVGNDQIGSVMSLLDIEASEIPHRTVGICGLAGIGKTTLADRVYNHILADFKPRSHYFVNVKEELKTQSLSDLKNKIIRGLSGVQEGVFVGTPGKIYLPIEERLKACKVLIVFDDVEDSSHLEKLAGDCNLYGKGSRIIVTSRDKQVLRNVCSEEHIYEVKILGYKDGLKLFSLCAFKQSHPIDEYLDLSDEFISYAQGLPLALRVLGSGLCNKKKVFWEDTLKKLVKIPDKDILQVLGTFIDGLGRNERNILLDIACFLRGEPRDEVERSAGPHFSPISGIDRLIDLSLVSVSSDGKVEMHDLIQQTGQELVFREDEKQPEMRSRLWKYEDISDVLHKDKGTAKIEGILLQPFTRGERKPGNIKASKTAFEKMPNLRFLKLGSEFRGGGIDLPDGLESLPKTLSYLSWYDYPLQHLPLDTENLEQLCLLRSNLESLSDGQKLLGKLKYLNLQFSDCLKSIPDLGRTPNLEILNVAGCSSLDKITLTNLQDPSKLKILNCNSTFLLEIPENIGSLSALEELHVRYSMLCYLPPSIIQLSKLKILNCSCTSLSEIPTNIGSLSALEELDLGVSMLICLPPSIIQLSKLKILNCSHTSLSEIPEKIGSLSALEELHLGLSMLIRLPPSIIQLSKLKILSLCLCKKLEYLPELPKSLEFLDVHRCESLKSVTSSFLSLKGEESCVQINFAICSGLQESVYDKLVEDVFGMHLIKQRVNLCIAGHKMPPGIDYKEKGSSVSFPLEGGVLIGLSLCAVLVDFELTNLDSCTQIACDATFKDGSEQSFKFYIEWENKPRVQVSEDTHMFLWYEPFNEEGSFLKASFRFFVVDPLLPVRGSRDEGQIAACGVHPIYQNSN